MHFHALEGRLMGHIYLLNLWFCIDSNKVDFEEQVFLDFRLPSGLQEPNHRPQEKSLGHGIGSITFTEVPVPPSYTGTAFGSTGVLAVPRQFPLLLLHALAFDQF